TSKTFCCKGLRVAPLGSRPSKAYEDGKTFEGRMPDSFTTFSACGSACLNQYSSSGIISSQKEKPSDEPSQSATVMTPDRSQDRSAKAPLSSSGSRSKEVEPKI